MKRSRDAVILLVVVILVALLFSMSHMFGGSAPPTGAGTSPTGAGASSKATPSSAPVAAFEIDGVRLGMTRDEVRAILGPPVMGGDEREWIYRVVRTVSFNEAGRVVDVTGMALSRAGRRLIGENASEDDIVRVLGTPSSVKPGSNTYTWQYEKLPGRVIFTGSGTIFEIGSQ